jgi:hypothetical protein
MLFRDMWGDISSVQTIAETYAQERIDGYEIVFDWNEQKAE